MSLLLGLIFLILNHYLYDIREELRKINKQLKKEVE